MKSKTKTYYHQKPSAREKWEGCWLGSAQNINGSKKDKRSQRAWSTYYNFTKFHNKWCRSEFNSCNKPRWFNRVATFFQEIFSRFSRFSRLFFKVSPWLFCTKKIFIVFTGYYYFFLYSWWNKKTFSKQYQSERQISYHNWAIQISTHFPNNIKGKDRFHIIIGQYRFPNIFQTISKWETDFMLS